jgi:polo-like kinase 4
MISRMIYLKQQRVIHRDIKSDNILGEQNFAIKIIDFGLSRLISPNSEIEYLFSCYLFRSHGKLNKKNYNKTIDVRSLGCVFYHLFTFHLPFGTASYESMINLSRRGFQSIS